MIKAHLRILRHTIAKQIIFLFPRSIKTQQTNQVSIEWTKITDKYPRYISEILRLHDEKLFCVDSVLCDCIHYYRINSSWRKRVSILYLSLTASHKSTFSVHGIYADESTESHFDMAYWYPKFSVLSLCLNLCVAMCLMDVIHLLQNLWQC